MGVSEGWVVCSHNGEIVIAKELFGGVVVQILDMDEDSWGDPFYVMGWKIKLKQPDMDDNQLVRRDDV